MSAPGGTTPVAIRYAVRDDLAALTAIYNHYVVHTAATFDIEPFEVSAREEWFAHYARTGPHRLLVAVEGREVVGYACSSRFRPKPAYDPSIEVTVYLHPRATAAGVGTALYDRLFAELAGEGLHRAYAVISLPNPASVALHRKFGFVDAGTLTQCGRKFDQWWDVLYMERPIG
ncbi:MAG TPA: GNAT family N-acetyltransferase [Mycobacteriales bacterium]|nr:GNAT family N-acetyltransferase [Mycobacteriales bacterium]